MWRFHFPVCRHREFASRRRGKGRILMRRHDAVRGENQPFPCKSEVSREMGQRLVDLRLAAPPPTFLDLSLCFCSLKNGAVPRLSKPDSVSRDASLQPKERRFSPSVSPANFVCTVWCDCGHWGLLMNTAGTSSLDSNWTSDSGDLWFKSVPPPRHGLCSEARPPRKGGTAICAASSCAGLHG